MRYARPIALFPILLLAGSIPGQVPPDNPDQTKIRELVLQYVNARNSKDAEATRSLFTADADQLVSTGEWRKGIDALVQGAMASSKKETGNSSIAVDSIRFLDRDVAIAEGKYQTSSAGTGQIRSMWTTLVLKRTNLGWRIAAIRNMLPAPAGFSTSSPAR